MRYFLGLILSLFFVTNAHAISQAGAYQAQFNFNHGQGFQNSQLGTKIIRDGVHDLVVQYSFAVDGGAISTKTVMRTPATQTSPQEPNGTLPKGAVVIGCYIDVITAGTTSASGTMALSTGQSAGDLKAATAAASYTGIVACIPVQTAATAIKITADSKPYYAIATGALTAGKWNLHIQYVLSDM
jgi:hypothetical protein